MAKYANPILIIGLLLVVVLLFKQSSLFTIFTPNTPDVVLDKVVNKYYFPISETSRNTEACTNSNIFFGTSFKPDTSTLSSSTSNCMFVDSKSFNAKNKVSSSSGYCEDLGTEIKIDGKSPFAKWSLIKRGQDDYVICQDNPNQGYKYVVYIPSSKVCNVKYPNPQPAEKEGKYYCDGKKIYMLPCSNKPKQLIETCSLGCEYTSVGIDEGSSVKVAKCKGDYKPDVKTCSSDNRYLYTTNQAGNLTIERCCGCSNNVCTKCPANFTDNECALIGGDGKNDVNIYLYNGKVLPDYGYWVISQFANQTPYNEYTYNLYSEINKYACEGKIVQRKRDLRIGFGPLTGYAGWGLPPGPNSLNAHKPGDVTINDKLSNKKWPFLLFHEVGHVYTRGGHTNDNSIMDADGGDGKYRQYQIDIIRKNLNATG